MNQLLLLDWIEGSETRTTESDSDTRHTSRVNRYFYTFDHPDANTAVDNYCVGIIVSEINTKMADNRISRVDLARLHSPCPRVCVSRGSDSESESRFCDYESTRHSALLNYEVSIPRGKLASPRTRTGDV